MLTVPLVTLVVLWGFATSLTVPPAINLLNTRTNSDYAALPAADLVAELQRERALTLIYLGGTVPTPELDRQRARTDAAAAKFREKASSKTMQDAASDLGRRRITETLDALSILPGGRGFIDNRQVDRAGALGLYTGVIATTFRVYDAIAALDDQDLARQSRALIALGRAHEVLAQENALLAGAFTAGRYAEGEPSRVAQLIGIQRLLFADAVAELSDAGRVSFQKLSEGRAFTDLRAMEDRVVAQSRTGAAVPVPVRDWQNAYESVSSDFRDFELTEGEKVAQNARPVAIATFVRLGIVSVLGLLAVLITLLVSLRVGRSLLRRLTGLRHAALELAGLRLPLVVAKLRRGDEVDVEQEAPPLEYGSDEIGQLGRAFTDVQRTAVQSAVDEAELRKGLSEVFLNIARRSQTLLHRQLALLDKMERRTSEPDDLEDLFRVDHLATRMRRHAEDLVILAGAAPGRGWRNPVTFVDVIRGAVSEVEDYARVNVMAVEDAALVGRAVGDIIHLMAELIENATSFSPPHTRVHVAGQLVPNGYAIEVEDRGLGMSREAIADANERLTSPPDFDPANSARLGLFVVAQLAARHGVRVELRSSPYGGVTAVALIPNDLVVASGRGRLGRGPDDPPAWAEPVQPPMPTQPVAGRVASGRATVMANAEPADSPGAVPIRLDRRIRTISRLSRGGSRPAIAPSREPEPAAPDEPATPAEPGAAEPAAPVVSAAVQGTVETPTVPLSADGLPRRVRQANLARQLREAPDAADTDAEPPAVAGRTPEQIRQMMSSLQAGTVRGRRESAPDADTPPPAAAAPTVDAPATDPANGDHPDSDLPSRARGIDALGLGRDGLGFDGLVSPPATKDDWFQPARPNTPWPLPFPAEEPTDQEEDA